MKFSWSRGCLALHTTIVQFNRGRGVSTEVYNKRTLLPFVKLIHPDIFAQYGQQIRSANQLCVQSMYELWDALFDIEKSANRGVAEVFIRTPLKQIYELHCFAKTPDGATVRRVALTLRPPPALTRQNTVPSASARRALDAVQQPLFSFFLDIGVPSDPVSVLDPKVASSGSPPGVSRRVSSERERDDDLGAFGRSPTTGEFSSATAQLESIVFDRAVSARHFQSAVPPRARHSIPPPWPLPGIAATAGFGGKSSVSENNKKVSSARKPSAGRGLLLQQIEAFLRSGQVLVQNLELEEEAAVMERLKQFLIDYGDILSFSYAAWSPVVVVLTKLKSTSTGVPGTDTETKPGRRRSRESFNCQIKDGAYIVSVPYDFRVGDLLEYLRSHLPMTNPFHEKGPTARQM